MHRTTAAAGLLTAALLTAGCSSGSTPTGAQPTATGTAACHDAIKAQYDPNTGVLTGAPTQPPECAGLSTDQVSEIAIEVAGEMASS
ncbi:hypothetical protein [Peterkaempfera sp. SMS 1(5)a]|uniref:hypothetical protein n=1 Tax=Peterkaempfera podocarpi TaxID=3232308 RepID=UPI00366E8162